MTAPRATNTLMSRAWISRRRAIPMEYEPARPMLRGVGEAGSTSVSSALMILTVPAKPPPGGIGATLCPRIPRDATRPDDDVRKQVTRGIAPRLRPAVHAGHGVLRRHERLPRQARADRAEERRGLRLRAPPRRDPQGAGRLGPGLPHRSRPAALGRAVDPGRLHPHPGQ